MSKTNCGEEDPGELFPESEKLGAETHDHRSLLVNFFLSPGLEPELERLPMLNRSLALIIESENPELT